MPRLSCKKWTEAWQFVHQNCKSAHPQSRVRTDSGSWESASEIAYKLTDNMAKWSPLPWGNFPLHRACTTRVRVRCA